MTLRRAMIALALTLLAGCNTAPREAGGPAATLPGQSSRPETAALPPSASAPLTPDMLKGLSAAQIEDALGPPSFRRRDPPAEVWQYRVRGCTLDLFIYDEDGNRKVAHFAVRVPDGTGADIGARACLDEVRRQRDGRPIS